MIRKSAGAAGYAVPRTAYGGGLRPIGHRIDGWKFGSLRCLFQYWVSGAFFAPSGPIVS
jgi:hypothetical protein